MGVQVPPSAPYLTVSNVHREQSLTRRVGAPGVRPEFMTVLITIVHVIVCVFLIAVVLLQSGKSADIAAAFGGMGSQTAFGTRTAATVLSKATTWAAIVFMLTSITLSIFASRRGTSTGSVLSGTTSSPTKTAPAPAPAQQPPAPEPAPAAPTR